MPLELEKMLQCPACGGAIKLGWAADGSIKFCSCASSGAFRCSDFPVVRGQPILVDFGASVLDRDWVIATGAKSPLGGRVSRRSALRRLLLGSNRVAERNAERFLDLLRAKCGGRRPLVLVIGGGTISKGADTLYTTDDIDIIAFDIYVSPHTDFVADAHAIPLRGGSVDGVWIQAVLEHVLTPSQVVDEIWRVLGPNGIVYAETPFLQPVHEGAYDFTRFTESGHRWLFRKFNLVDSGPINGPGTTLFHCLRYFVGSLLRNRPLGSLVVSPLFWLRFLDRLADPAHSRDAAGAVYFLGQRTERGLAPSEMADFFKGVR